MKPQIHSAAAADDVSRIRVLRLPCIVLGTALLKQIDEASMARIRHRTSEMRMVRERITAYFGRRTLST
jgi:hypothetical protein